MRAVLFALGVVVSVASAQAADAERGATLYLRLPGGLVSCVSCHGPDPAANRNNLLRAAGQPDVLLKTLNAVGVMGYLKPALQDADLIDLSAYLDTVARAAGDTVRTAWPRTIEFGSFSPGSATPTHEVWLRNRSAAPLDLAPPRLMRGLFMLSHNCPPVLPVNAECRASLRASAAVPVTPGDFTDALVWPSATPGVMGVSAAAVSGAAAPLDTDRASLDFGSVKVGTTSAVQRLTVRNSGTAEITLGVFTLTGPGAGAYALDSGCESGRLLAPGANCTVEVSFRPGAETAYEAALQWRSSGGNPAPVRLDGRGAVQLTSVPAPVPTTPATIGTGSGGGGCAALPPAARGDISLMLLLAAAAAALAVRRHSRYRHRITLPHRRHQKFTISV